MPLRPSNRLPRRFNRRVTSQTRSFVERRHSQQRKKNRERFRRLFQRFRRKFGRWWKFFRHHVFIGITLLCIVLVVFLLWSPLLSVREIRIVRTSPRVDIEDVQNILSSFFGRRLFVLSPSAVRRLLHESISDIKTVTVGKKYPSTLVVRIEPEPLFVRVQIEDSDARFLVFEQGTGAVMSDALTEKGLFISGDRIQEEAENLPLLHIVDWGARPQPGDRVLGEEFLHRIIEAEQSLTRSFGHKIKQRIVFLRAQEFHIQTDRHILWFDVRSSVGDHLQRYRIFLEEIGTDQAKEYIDLRLNDRVIYK